MNNRVTITFSRNFVAGDGISVYYSDPSTQTAGYWKFIWVSGTPGAFQVQQGTSEATTAENFASAWTNSLNGFTVTQPVSGNDNQVQITSQTYHFVNVLAIFSSGNTMAIPGNYNYALSTVSTGNKITYEQKFPLNTPTADSKYLWRSDDANEVKTKFNLNDDRIGDLETDKANLVGGNNFTGNQTIDGIITVKDSTDSVLGDAYLKNFGLECERDPSYIRPIANNVNRLFLGGASAGEKDWSLVRVFASQLDISGDVGIGVTDPKGKLQVYESGNTSYKTYDDTKAGVIIQSYQSNNSDFKKTTDIVASSDGTVPSEIRMFTRENGQSAIQERLRVDSEGNLGIGTTTPSQKLEVKGKIYINPEVNVLPDGQPASMLVFRSKNSTGLTQAKSSIYALNSIEEKSGITFSTQQGSSDLNPRLEIRQDDGDVEVKQNILVNQVIKLNGTSRAYADLPSTPTVGMFSYITDASSVSYRATASGGGSDVALVFYDGSNWIYH